MSRVVVPSALRIVSFAVPLVLLTIGWAAPVAAQELPACSDDQRSECVLPDWSEAGQRDTPSLFGEVDGTVWIEDERGDAPEGGIDILAVGAARVSIDDPGPIRESNALLKRGKLKRAVPAGEAVLVRIVLDRPLEVADGGHASVHLATDADGSRSNNAPSGVGAADFPLAGTQHVYSLAWASTTGKTKLLSSNLAKGWYKAKQPFAASWAAPNVLDILVAPSAMGDRFRVATYTAGRTGGYDTVALGPAAVPLDGMVGLEPRCLEGAISAEPFVIQRLVENGQSVRDVEARASWRGGAALPVEPEVQPLLEGFIAERDEDGDGRVAIRTWVNLFEDGLVIRQRPELELAMEDGVAYLALELGLTRRGYNLLRGFEPESTGDEALDAWLERATDALRETMPPFRLGNKGGLLAGEAIGACVPWLEPQPASEAEAEDPSAVDDPTVTDA